MLSKIFQSLFAVLRFFPVFLLGSCVGYEVKDNKVYFKTWDEGNGRQKHLVAADVETFEILKFENWGKDKNTVFYRGIPLKGADPASFEVLSKNYVKDHYSAWYGFKQIKGAHGKTFHLLEGGYAADEYDLYYMQLPLGSNSPKNYQVIYKKKNGSAEWITDGEYYYHYTEKIPSDDYENVTIYLGSDGIAKDNQWVYYNGKKMNYDYKGNRIIDTVDIASFEVTNLIDCHDKWGCINVFKGRVECNENARIMPIIAVNPKGKPIEK